MALSLSVLNITTHLGGGLGAMIGAYIANSTLKHAVLELEETLNPCLDKSGVTVLAPADSKELAEIIFDHDVVLVHYYCHPMIVWTLFELRHMAAGKVVVWCHNNGISKLQPLPDGLSRLTDSVLLSGCADSRFTDGEVIRPVPLRETLSQARKELMARSRAERVGFRYIGSLDRAKVHENALEWFRELAAMYDFSIATLDTEHDFAEFRVLTGETRRSVLYDGYFCLVYPLTATHYGCGELGLQELLMLGYPVVACRNKVEVEILEGLDGVFFVDSSTSFSAACSKVAEQWNQLQEGWWDRADHNMQTILSRRPYARLDEHLSAVVESDSGLGIIEPGPTVSDLIRFAYNQQDDQGLCEVLSAWEHSGRGVLPRKGAPAQFQKCLSSKTGSVSLFEPETWDRMGEPGDWSQEILLRATSRRDATC